MHNDTQHNDTQHNDNHFVTLSIMTRSIMTGSITTFSIMALSIMTQSKTTLTIMTLSIMTLNIMRLSIMAVSIKTSKNKQDVALCTMILSIMGEHLNAVSFMLSVTYAGFAYAKCHLCWVRLCLVSLYLMLSITNAECHLYAFHPEFPYAGCHHAK
jgi:hypothetical protein